MRSKSKMIAKMLRKLADNIDSGTCGMDDDEIMSLAQMVTHRKLNIEQSCQHFNVSRATLNRWQQSGKFPEFRKDSGGKDYVWMDEAEEAVEKWEQENE